MTPTSIDTLRRLLLALLAFGLAGIGLELTFLEHYTDASMMIPIVLVPAAILVVGIHAWIDRAWSVRLLRVTMAALLIAGITGVVLHFRGSLAFQIDMDPTLSRAELFWKVLHMKAPPTIAPGVLAELGLLGLIATYRHPSLVPSSSPTKGVVL